MVMADLVLSRQGKPRVVVEAKSRAAPADFVNPVFTQLRRFAFETGSEWMVLADPEHIRIFKGQELVPVAELDTMDVLTQVDMNNVKHVGEPVVLLAVDRWLRKLQSERGLAVDSELAEFAEAVRGSDESTYEFQA
jgi:hypothetical protein